MVTERVPAALGAAIAQAEGVALAHAQAGDAVSLTFRTGYREDCLATDYSWTDEGEDRPRTRLGEQHRVCLLITAEDDSLEFAGEAEDDPLEHSFCPLDRPIEQTVRAVAARDAIRGRMTGLRSKSQAKRLEFTPVAVMVRDGVRLRQIDGPLVYDPVLGMRYQGGKA
jgi:hypothetical protein